MTGLSLRVPTSSDLSNTEIRRGRDINMTVAKKVLEILATDESYRTLHDGQFMFVYGGKGKTFQSYQEAESFREGLPKDQRRGCFIGPQRAGDWGVIHDAKVEWYVNRDKIGEIKKTLDPEEARYGVHEFYTIDGSVDS